MEDCRVQKFEVAVIPMTETPDIKMRGLESISCLAGSLDITNVPLVPFSDEACAFLAELSSVLMADAQAHTYPDIISFAFWCRKSNIEKARQHALARMGSLDNRIGRGLSFHIAPSNIPVNFAFSFAFSLLAGNANIVRVPSKPFQQVRIICSAVNAVLPRYQEISNRCAFISYPHDDDITTLFSQRADARLIWGGDKTVQKLQAIPRLPRCVDIMFSDRYSLALINGTFIDAADDSTLASLAKKFYNDTYLMDQNACSSPQLIVWQHASVSTRQRFWSHVRAYAEKTYYLQAQVAIDKYVQLCRDIMEGSAKPQSSFDGILTTVNLDHLPGNIHDLRGQGGYFYQIDISNLIEIASHITERVQTLVYFGYEPDELRDFIIKNTLRGIDRIVPIGSAMDIDIVWDGHDLVSELSRIVDTR